MIILSFYLEQYMNDEAFLLFENRLSSPPFRVYLDHG